MSLLPVDQAIARIVAGVGPLPSERVLIADAAGRVLAEPLTARRTHPPFPISAMDGYAVIADDLPAAGARATVIGISAAGHGFAGKLSRGECVRIFTGAPLPAGADAVLMQENAEVDGSSIVAREPARRGRHIRPAGLDFHTGDLLVAAGQRLGMGELALAAAAGDGSVTVRRRPRVAILATGDELVPPGADPGPDQIVASNTIGIAALAGSLGADTVDLGISPDQIAAIVDGSRRARAAGADILVTLGGASVGDHDLVRPALTAEGMALDFWKIAMRPGKPLMFGRLGDMRVLGLPGNPVSSLVCSLLFLKPLIEAFLGIPPADPTVAARLGSDLPANDARQDYVRARLEPTDDGLAAAIAFPVQDSAMLTVFSRSDCLIVRAPGASPARAGEPCRIIPLP